MAMRLSQAPQVADQLVGLRRVEVEPRHLVAGLDVLRVLDPRAELSGVVGDRQRGQRRAAGQVREIGGHRPARTGPAYRVTARAARADEAALAAARGALRRRAGSGPALAAQPRLEACGRVGVD